MSDLPVVVKLAGGLGNQIFQYAMGLAQARKFNTDLWLDVSSFTTDHQRAFCLKYLYAGVNSDVVRLDQDSRDPVVKERGMPYQPDLLEQIKPGCILDGYWQSEKYFRWSRIDKGLNGEPLTFAGDISAELRGRLVPRQPLPASAWIMAGRILQCRERSVMLHIRRTDALSKQDYHGVLPLTYYQEAVDRVSYKIPDPVIFVFSDDLAWCRENLDFGEHEIVFTEETEKTTPSTMGREDIDIYLMSLCHNAIIANSTYSWFGAWLGDEKKDRLVFAPKLWFTSKDVDSRDIIPKRWVRL